MKIGIGLTTFQRPEYFKQSIAAITEHALPIVDYCFVYNDGSKIGEKEYRKIHKTLDPRIKYRYMPKNKGVAAAKNYLLKRMMEAGCDYMFLIEDDILIKDPKAITEYIRLSELSGIEHFLFAHHGPANEGMLFLREKGVDLYTACVGAYCMYTRKVIEEVGYFDEEMFNAMEHVEHTFRIARAGYSTPIPTFPDITNSVYYLEEIPGSIDNSSIKQRQDWTPNIILALERWQAKDPEFPYAEKLKKIKEELGL